MVNFKERLKELREGKQISRDELAKAIKLSYWAIAKYETGERTPDPETLQKLADFFDCSVDYLLGRNENPRDQNNSSTPSWWHRDTTPTDVELEEFLKTANVYFDGVPLDEDDKEDILTYLKVKWEREKRKRDREKR
ncbi:helix-turn-helix domain-containing protein [Desulfofundulus thermobenzoicus]|uniref:Helix-turn-helix domain-containing protein n=1 Tax=Desulfofundulus thermobenzoicus TaxID=29376 RepID=A0A6N7IQX6_9FIRM|nr:helix-turn-helix domain-containing protein [Desulfofundulus thermobenzoicus]HHW42220.1 helix-turn-helix domain-containing protein [Desulfotomaculum sp.]